MVLVSGIKPHTVIEVEGKLYRGIEILVQQFVETGDLVRVDTEKIKYVERVTVKRV
jgi:hypothetical protein